MNIMLSQLAKLAPVELYYSDVTHKYYWSVRGLEVKRGIFLEGVCEHRDTPEEALDAFVEAIVGERLRLNGKDIAVIWIPPSQTANDMI